MNSLLDAAQSSVIPNASTTRPKSVDYIDLSRGAGLHRIKCPKVLLERTLLEKYSEVDPGLGFNAVGVILNVLAQHIAKNPGGGRDDSLLLALMRREDAHEMEVILNISRTRRQGQECLMLTCAGEREIVDHD